MRFAVESWDPSYGSATDSLDLDPSAEPADASIEIPLAQWAPVLAPSDPIRPQPIWFVDGVRRIDARVWIDEAGLSKPGVCATVAAGAVRTEGTVAQVTDVLVHRGLYTTPTEASAITTRCGTYELVACTGTTPEDTYLAIHGQMTDLERRVSAAAGATELVVVDGPLRGRSGANAVGYVKTQHVQYLPPDQHAVLGRLEPGQRTPLFLIGGRQARYSWYLRLPGPRTHPLASIVRCEVPAVGEVAASAERASTVTFALGRFASEPHKDTRAPQNLYPIAGLEQELRRRLGDARLMERALRVASASGTE